MKGRNPTKAESDYMSEITSRIGCVICWLYRNEFNECEIHHIDGKTKQDAHFLTLGLCAHDHRLAPDSRHGNKAVFTAKYGTEIYLKIKQDERLRAEGVEIPELTNFKNKYVMQYLQELSQGRNVEDCI